VWNCRPDEDDDDLPPALLPYYIESVMPTAKWDEVAAGLVARGVPQNRIDTWRANHPEATPLDVRRGFERFVEKVS
jgi:hypothetical protein